MLSSAPNPGSREAIDAGCNCPRVDNGWGRGYMHEAITDGSTVFITRDDCPLHGDEATAR